MNTNQTLGGWSPFSTVISAEAKTVFETALTGLVGVVYQPLAVSNQVVAGMNYHFLCNSKGVYPGAESIAAMVAIYQPLQGKPHITSIKKID